MPSGGGLGTGKDAGGGATEVLVIAAGRGKDSQGAYKAPLILHMAAANGSISSPKRHNDLCGGPHKSFYVVASIMWRSLSHFRLFGVWPLPNTT